MNRGKQYWVLVLTVLFSQVSALAATWQVSPGGSLSSVKEAVHRASPFDTIAVHGGTYAENLIEINKPLVLLGFDNPLIDSRGGDEIFVVTSDSVTISGFRLENIGVSFTKDRAAIRLNRVNNVTVENNQLKNTFFGIYLQYSSDCFLIGNTVIGNEKDEASAGNAIHVWKADRILVLNNVVHHHRDGIYFEFVNQSLIKGNDSRHNLRYGLHFMFSNEDVYENNVFSSNGAGVAVMFSKKITMLENTFEENWGGASYGILLKEISDGVMRRNVFRRNTIGVYAEGANRVQIVENTFFSNGKAMDIKGNCLDNRIERNNFINNTFEVLTNSRSNANLFSGNYWSQYRGYDLDKDGVGDVPHRPVNLFAMVTDQIPAANMLLHSFLVNSLEIAERVFPQLIPEQLVDESPKMKPYRYD